MKDRRAVEGPQRVAVAEVLPRQQPEPRSGSRSCPAVSLFRVNDIGEIVRHVRFED